MRPRDSVTDAFKLLAQARHPSGLRMLWRRGLCCRGQHLSSDRVPSPGAKPGGPAGPAAFPPQRLATEEGSRPWVVVKACHRRPGPGAHTPGRPSVWPACHTVGSGSTPVIPGSQESVQARSSRAQRGWEGKVVHSAQRLDEREAGQPAGSEHRRHRAWEQPHLIGNLQRGEGRVSAVALATTLSHCNEAGRGRRLVLKEHEANRFAFQRGLSRNSAPSQRSLARVSSIRRTARGRCHETYHPS